MLQNIVFNLTYLCNMAYFALKKNKIMDKKKVNALLIHIEHSKPIELNEFTTSLNAIGGLFSSFAQLNGESKEMSQSKLYVEKIENGCIDIFLCETVASCMLPFMENMNIILEFSSYIKSVLEYFTLGKGDRPELSLQEAKGFKDLLNITANDNKGEMSIGAIAKGDKNNIFHNCTFNFSGSNSAQNQLDKEIEELKTVQPMDGIFSRQLMKIYQVRGDMASNAGNKAVIDAISNKKLNVVFETDELKHKILNSADNPIRKAYLVDVLLMTIEGKPAAYKVIALHDTIPLD